MRFQLISCEVLYREMCASLAKSPHEVDVVFLTKGLHDLGGARMSDQLQERIDQVEPGRYDAILLGYALCGNGAAGLKASNIPLVLPRAHDCIALLMGSREKYAEYFKDNSGVYFRSTGWLERGDAPKDQPGSEFVRRETGLGYELAELVKRYGEESGRYLFDELHRYENTYSQLTFIETGLEPDGSFEERARREAEKRGWRFAKVRGSLSLFERLVNGDWNEKDFLVVQPGYRVAATYDDDILRAEKWVP